MTRQITKAALAAQLAGREQSLRDLQARVLALETELDVLRDETFGPRRFLEAMAVDAPIPVAVLHGESGTTKWSNAAWQRHFSANSPQSFLALVEPDTGARPADIAGLMVDSGRPFYQGEFESGPPEAAVSHWRCTFILFPAIKSSPPDVMLLVADITDRKSMEQALRQTRDLLRDEAGQLERRVAERTAEQRKLNAALRAEIDVREKVEQAYREQAIRLREQADLLDLAPVAIIVRDWGNRVRFWNAGATEVYGWTAAEVAGRDLQAVLRTVFPTPLAQIEADLQAKGRWEGELVHTRRDGSQITTLSRWALQRDELGRPTAVLEINSDISAQKRAQAQIAYQAYLLANTSDMISAVDLEGRVTAWNQAAEQTLGLKVEDVLGRPYTEVLAAGCPACTLEEALFDLLQDGSWRGEALLHRPHGSDLPVEVGIMALPNRDGEFSGFVAVARDLTARKQAEQATEEHARRLQILHDIDRAILAARSPREIAATALGRVREVTGVRRAGVMLFGAQPPDMDVLAVDGVTEIERPLGTRLPMEWGWVDECRRGQITVIEDLEALRETWPATESLLEHGIRSAVGFPLMTGEQVIGALAVGRAESGPPPPDLLAFGRQVADSLAVTLQNARLFAQVQAGRLQTQAFSRRLVGALEDERRTLARELHDEAGQSLTTLALGLGRLRREPLTQEALQEQVAELQAIASGVMEDLHRLAVNLRPIVLDRYGLVPALEQYVESFGRRSDLQVQFVAVGLGEERFAPEVETALYRVVQEALTNVARHAAATQASVVVERRPDVLLVIVEDNGCGFDVDMALDSGRLGLLGMRERAEMLGGSLAIESAAGAGCSIFAAVPLLRTTSAPDAGGPSVDDVPQSADRET